MTRTAGVSSQRPIAASMQAATVAEGAGSRSVSPAGVEGIRCISARRSRKARVTSWRAGAARALTSVAPARRSIRRAAAISPYGYQGGHGCARPVEALVYTALSSERVEVIGVGGRIDPDYPLLDPDPPWPESLSALSASQVWRLLPPRRRVTSTGSPTSSETHEASATACPGARSGSKDPTLVAHPPFPTLVRPHVLILPPTERAVGPGPSQEADGVGGSGARMHQPADRHSPGVDRSSRVVDSRDPQVGHPSVDRISRLFPGALYDRPADAVPVEDASVDDERWVASRRVSQEGLVPISEPAVAEVGDDTLRAQAPTAVSHREAFDVDRLATEEEAAGDSP